MIPLPLTRIAQLTRGALADVSDPHALVTGPVVIDSRQAEPGALFVALAGDRLDGHDFARQACRAGATAVLAAREVGAPAVVVPDVVTALGKLAGAVLAELPKLTVVGVTGSSGKSTTKDLLGQVLERLGPTIVPVSSYNNEIGHPLTVLRADSATRYLVLEVSARGLGHIAHLTRIAPPHIGVVLNVGSAHLGEFGSKDVVARAKGELVEALGIDGVAVLNADDPLVRAMAARTAARITLFGRALDAQVRAQDEGLDAAGRPFFSLVTPRGSAPVRLRWYGAHMVGNALATAAVAYELGMAVADIAELLSQAVPLSRWRMEVCRRPDGVTVVNDAYNANPESMRAALEALTAMARGRRAYAVLGEMAELGSASTTEHETIGRLAVQRGLTGLVVVGENARPIYTGARSLWERSAATELRHVPDVAAAVTALREWLSAGDVVLVKASRVAGLERVAEALLDEAAHVDEGSTAG